jgi:tetratricopeptide (TPR) repeat protein
MKRLSSFLRKRKNRRDLVATLMASALPLIATCQCQKHVESIAQPGEASPRDSGLAACAADAGRGALEEEATGICPPANQIPIDQALSLFAQKQFQASWACAGKALALEPDEVLPYVVRSKANAALSQWQAAMLDLNYALAIEPDSTDALLWAAQFYGARWNLPKPETSLALRYAEKGLALSTQQNDREQLLEFQKVLARLYNNSGRSQDALEAIGAARELGVDDEPMRYEAALAYFELGHMGRAKPLAEGLLSSLEQRPYAAHLLALILEREGAFDEAQALFVSAQRSNPREFLVPVDIDTHAFQVLVDDVRQSLPRAQRDELKHVAVILEDTPSKALLARENPPLSPTALGAFDEGDVAEQDTLPVKKLQEKRAVYLFRKNLQRVSPTVTSLREQIRKTLMHEAAHVRGETDAELNARGLE